ncbi:lysophospholipid acyltransferase family protein [Geminisphaera colitermitum]|uniref:lysophospholipid acyltransferase family protein n=1 Tax=Geminisphaera colitermitum TaxID=1148786 RepID=UPI0009DF488F|nr:lipid A biosynthesis acyltransferase [Geminisphaera colitermitum]
MGISQHKGSSSGAVHSRPRGNSRRTAPSLFKRLRWRLEFWVYVVFEGILVLLPASTVADWGAAAGRLGWRVMKARRHIVRRNLRIAFADRKTRAEIDAMVREVFQRTGANLLSALRSSRVSEEELRLTIRIVNPDALEELGADRERGAVAVLPHMGNWEALSQAMSGQMPHEHPLGTIYQFIKNPLLDSRVTQARARMGMELFEKHSGPLEMAAFIRRGGWLAVLADQRVESVGEIVPLFGRLTSCTPLPAMMARRTGAVIFGASVKTVAPGRWAVKIHRLQPPEVTTVACMRLLEETIMESPEDVFWFQDRWRPNRREPARIAGRPPRDAASAAWTKPRRALAWLAANDVNAGGGGGPIRLPESPYGDLVWEYSVPRGQDVAWLPKNARIHFYDASASSGRRLEAELTRIDDAEALPLEFIFTLQRNHALEAAAKALRLPVQVRRVE